jgi:hypothetical protein
MQAITIDASWVIHMQQYTQKIQKWFDIHFPMFDSNTSTQDANKIRDNLNSQKLNF